jgi:hypothetical protein
MERARRELGSWWELETSLGELARLLMPKVSAESCSVSVLEEVAVMVSEKRRIARRPSPRRPRRLVPKSNNPTTFGSERLPSQSGSQYRCHHP